MNPRPGFEKPKGIGEVRFSKEGSLYQIRRQEEERERERERREGGGKEGEGAVLQSCYIGCGL